MDNHEILCKIRERMPAEMDAVLVENPVHQYYLSGFNFCDGHVVIGREKAWLFTDFRYIEAANGSAAARDFEIFDKSAISVLHSTLQNAGVKNLGYEDRYMTVDALQKTRIAMPGMNFLPIGDLIEGQRRFKTDAERECIRRAQAITDATFAHILNFITPERTETEIALELEFFMRKNGAERASFDIICVSGKKSSLPHGEPENRRLEPGFLTMDFGCTYKGYCSDMTRTVATGAVDGEMRRLYDTVRRAQELALEYIDWHKSCFEADRIARDYINQNGYEGAFGHSLGHGVGLYIHENPRLSPACKPQDILENGDVVTCEPGIYLAGKYGVRIEDMVLIHDGGAEAITRSPKELIIL